MTDLDSFNACYAEVERSTDMEDYEADRKTQRKAERLAQATRSHSMITEKDIEEEKRQEEEVKRYAAQKYMKIGRLDAARMQHLETFNAAYARATMGVDMEDYEADR
ncbi:MAG: hypothetical protein JSR29_15850 [Nitrospira sp.]|nr:hypothetical protein [Nitrospira sp.]